MKTYSGVLKMKKREIANIRLLLEHVERDISYGSGGSFGDGDKFDEKEAEKVKKAIENIEWILELQK